MDIDEKISEFIGNVADLVVSLNSGCIQQSDLVTVFKIAGIENQDGDDYTRSDGIIRKAYIYHSTRSNTNTASNIQTVFEKKNGAPIIK
jgi:hypothetical protein